MRGKGFLITMEGNEGSGKSTQIKLLYDALKKKGHQVYLTREPGGTPISDAIRAVLLDHRNEKMTALCETLLYMASRAQLVDEVIATKLRAGTLVLCDRWLDATMAYQGTAGGVDKTWIKSLGDKVTQGIRPKLTLFLDLPLLCGLKRATSHKKADRLERKKIAFHRKVRAGYEAIAKAEPGRFKRVSIKEEDSIAEVHEKIKKRVEVVLYDAEKRAR